MTLQHHLTKTPCDPYHSPQYEQCYRDKTRDVRGAFTQQPSRRQVSSSDLSSHAPSQSYYHNLIKCCSFTKLLSQFSQVLLHNLTKRSFAKLSSQVSWHVRRHHQDEGKSEHLCALRRPTANQHVLQENAWVQVRAVVFSKVVLLSLDLFF